MPSYAPVRRRLAAICAVLLLAGCASTAPPRRAPAPELPALAQQVEIRRTEYGVPHILAENLRAAAFALAWVQVEDHGTRVITGMHAARGRMALHEGARRIDADARARLRHARATATFDSLHADTRDFYTGFAEGLNHYIRIHRDALPAWLTADFTGADILARDVVWPSDGALNALRARQGTAQPDTAAPPPDYEGTAYDDVGSNAWALAPSRTTSGRAILLRNPHLAWTAGYYEAHVRVPGRLDFYGDFRIGGPFTVIGGFNPYLGFSTTNNASRSHEYYAFAADPGRPDHYIVDGRSVPLQRDVVTVPYRADDGSTATVTREFWHTEFGPVAHRDGERVYVYRAAAHGSYRAGEQWLEMMKAQSLEQWKDAMRIGARTTSNFTYADRDGNILYVWVSGAPLLPHEPGGDTAIVVTRSDQVWQRRAPFDSLPQLLNPPGGYIRNENDSPHFTNLNAVMPHAFSFAVEAPSLRLRSQHALELLHNDRSFSLEDVVETKHSMRMLLADRVKADLVAAVRAYAGAGSAVGGVAVPVADRDAAPLVDARTLQALDLLVRWDNTVAADSRGGVLFETWWNRYRTVLRGQPLHAVEWSSDAPAETPHGLADAARAVEAFAWAVAETERLFGSPDVAWGDVHRVRRGDVDAPVGGCTGALGCFRVLQFTAAADGRRVVRGGDGWIIAVEFGDRPRAYSMLGYGQSPDPASPWHANQAALFAAGRMKAVRWSEEEITAQVVRSYRPGDGR
jgi:acyl-homoserine-lactone acylase